MKVQSFKGNMILIKKNKVDLPKYVQQKKKEREQKKLEG